MHRRHRRSRQVRMVLHRDRLFRVVLAHVLVHLLHRERLAVLVVPDHPQPGRLVVLVVRDVQIVRSRVDHRVTVGRGVLLLDRLRDFRTGLKQ